MLELVLQAVLDGRKQAWSRLLPYSNICDRALVMLRLLSDRSGIIKDLYIPGHLVV